MELVVIGKIVIKQEKHFQIKVQVIKEQKREIEEKVELQNWVYEDKIVDFSEENVLIVEIVNEVDIKNVVNANEIFKN